MSHRIIAAGGWSAAARLLGLGVRARNVVVGVEGVRAAATRGSLRLALLAADASGNSRDKVVPLLRGKSVTLLVAPSARELGEALGRPPVVAAGVLDARLAQGIRNIVAESPAAGSEE